MPYNLSNLTQKMHDLKVEKDAVETASNDEFNELIKSAHLNDLNEKIRKLNTDILDRVRLTGRLFRGDNGVYLCIGHARGHVHFVKRNDTPVMISYDKINFVDAEHYEINGKMYYTDGTYFEVTDNICYLEHMETYTNIRCKKREVVKHQELILKKVRPENYSEMEDEYFETSAQIRDFDELKKNFEKIIFKDLKRIRDNYRVGALA